MVPNGESSLIIQSRTMTTAQITAVIGIEPTHASERGEPVSPRIDRTREWCTWILDGEPNSDPEDRSGFGSMRNLLARLGPRAASIATLHDECELRLDWFGFSDSDQGGFVIPADVLKAAGDLGCPLFGTVYLSDEPRDEE